MTQANDEAVIPVNTAHYPTSLYGGGGTDAVISHQTLGLDHIVPHSRTLRKAREQINQMVSDGVSPQRIRSYLHQWAMWWVRTTESWHYQKLHVWFLNVCWDFNPAAYAAGLLHNAIRKYGTNHYQARVLLTSGFHAIA